MLSHKHGSFFRDKFSEGTIEEISDVKQCDSDDLGDELMRIYHRPSVSGRAPDDSFLERSDKEN